MMKKLKILAAGDLHGDMGIAKKLSEKAKKGKVDLVVLAGDIYGYTPGDGKILEPFRKANQKIVFVPGNCEFDEECEMLARDGKSIHNYYVTYGGVGIAGIGSPNWKLELDEEDLEGIKKNFEKMKAGKRILVSHLHAEGTSAEFSGIPGDKILKRAVKYFKPDLLISAHIHEAEGIEDKIGKTKVIQVGRRGKILEI
ncbi:metallophosphoesterase [Candidatus Pacearchaeota archaeon]|nr:metallophosphoesterase [Candidatus Pacearchaeota archaeon]